jgi:hypothetical protein
MNAGGFENWERLLGEWLGRAPLLLVLGLVGVVCLMRLSDRPREHWLLGLAVVLLLFGQLGMSHVTSFLVQQIRGGMAGGGETSMLLIQFAVSVPSALINASAWGLLLYAAFGAGSGRRSRYLIEDEPSGRETM